MIIKKAPFGSLFCCNSVNGLFVHLELLVAGLEEADNLAGSCLGGVDVGLGGLGTLFLRGGEETLLEAFEQTHLHGGDVGAVFEVFAFSHQGGELLFVDDLLAGGVCFSIAESKFSLSLHYLFQ